LFVSLLGSGHGLFLVGMKVELFTALAAATKRRLVVFVGIVVAVDAVD
jgi:hypothetical protein